MTAAPAYLTGAGLLGHCLRIAESYSGNLTVRQLYYRLVATGLLGSSQKEYRRVVQVLTTARLNGSFPLDWLMDRTRTAEAGDYTTSLVDVDDALDAAAEGIKDFPRYLLRQSVWHGQKTHVSVWVEKEALAGVFQGPCEARGVGLFVCRGYPSVSSLYQWVCGVVEAVDANPDDIDRVKILYFGDHDPDGWQIPRSALANARTIAQTTGLWLPPVHLDRIALNMDQILRFNPPPFPAKTTSPRYRSYFDEHQTNNAWELDALDPDVLEGMIGEAIEAEFDMAIHIENRAFVAGLREEMGDRMQTEEWMREALR